jgi:hypothetical protein
MYSEYIMKVITKKRRKLHTDTKERENRDTRGAVILTPQNGSLFMSCEYYVNTNSERSVRFSEDDDEDYFLLNVKPCSLTDFHQRL